MLGSAHLAALWALAFVQPMLSLLGDSPEFFVARGNTTAQILIYAFSITLIPPLIGLGIEALARLISRDFQWGVHLTLMTLVGACIPLHLLKTRLEWPAGVLIAISLLLAVAGVLAYSRWRFPRSFMDILIVAPLLVLIVFLFFSPSSRLILPREQPTPADVTVKNPAPVVMVIFDELPLSSLETPDGKIDSSRYPAFAELADHSTWYRNATAAAAYTPLAVPALLSGTKPRHDTLPIASDHPRSIFTLLGGSYRMNVMETATRICPEKLCPDESEIPKGSLTDLFGDLWIVSRYLALPDSMTRNLPDISQTFSDFSDENAGSAAAGTAPVDESPIGSPTGSSDQGSGDPASPEEATAANGQPRTGQGGARKLGRLFAGQSTADELDRVNEFNRNLKSGQDRTLDLIHVEKPHYPWRHIPDGQRYSILAGEWSGVLPNDGAWETWTGVTDIALQRHLLETGYTDTLLGQIIGRLKKTGLWDRALVVVAADHGAAFTPRVQRRMAEKRNLGQIASIPLFVKSPGQTEAKQVDQHVCASGVLPLMAAELKIDYPWGSADCPPDRARVLNSPQGQASGSMERVKRQRTWMTDRIASLFGHGGGWQPVYQYGRYSQELIGRKVRRLNVIDQLGRPRAVPDRPNLVKSYDPEAATVLGLLQRGDARKIGQNQMLAAAVDGVIQAVGVTFKNGPDALPGYSILLPPNSLKAGFNRVDLYLVEKGGKRLQLVYDGNKPLSPNAQGQN